MCLQIANFTHNKHALKPIQDFSSSFGPVIRELSAAINGNMNRYTIDI